MFGLSHRWLIGPCWKLDGTPVPEGYALCVVCEQVQPDSDIAPADVEPIHVWPL